MAVQLAAARRTTVIATAAGRNHALLRELGTTPVAYGPGLAGRTRAAAPQCISAATDFAGTDEALDVSLELVADRALIASITGPPRRAEAGIKLLGYGPGQDAGAEIRDAARADVAERAGPGARRVIIGATFPLARGCRTTVNGQYRRQGDSVTSGAPLGRWSVAILVSPRACSFPPRALQARSGQRRQRRQPDAAAEIRVRERRAGRPGVTSYGWRVNKWPGWLNQQPTWRFALMIAGFGLALFLIALGIEYLVTDGRVDLSYTVGFMFVTVVTLTVVAIYDRRRASRQRH